MLFCGVHLHYRKNMYSGADTTQINGGEHKGGGHQIGNELKRTGR